MNIVAAEWRKARTTWVTTLVLAVIVGFVGLMCLLAWYAAATWDSLPPEGRERFAVSPLPDLTLWIVQLCLAVYGVLAITAEHRSGMIRTTFTVTPNRWAVLGAKVVVVGGIALVTTAVAVFGTSLLGRLIIGDRPIPGQPPLGEDQTVVLLCMTASGVMFALFGLGIGAVLRSAAGAIAILVALWHILPLVAHNLPDPWSGRLGSVMLGALPGQLAGAGNDNSIYGALLSPAVAAVVMVLYAAVPLGLAGLALRRDVR
jgi:ABC-2 type transport system permease protein